MARISAFVVVEVSRPWEHVSWPPTLSSTSTLCLEPIGVGVGVCGGGVSDVGRRSARWRFVCSGPLWCQWMFWGPVVYCQSWMAVISEVLCRGVLCRGVVRRRASVD